MKQRFGVNQGTFGPKKSVNDICDNLSKAGIMKVGLWKSLIDNEYNSTSIAQLSEIIQSKGMTVFEINFLKDWMDVEGDKRQSLAHEVEDMCTLAIALGSRSITAATFSTDYDSGRVKTNLEIIGRTAMKYGLMVDLEFLPWQEVSTLKQAISLINEVELQNIGVLLDTFHFFNGSNTLNDLDEHHVKYVSHVHISDFPKTSKYESLIEKTRYERIFPPEGSLPVIQLIRRLELNGYTGDYSLEVLNEKHADLGIQDIVNRASESIDKISGCI